MLVRRISSSFLFAALVAALAPGCGGLESDCVEVCEDSKACPDGNKNENCNANCALLADAAEHTGCEDEVAAIIECSRTDVCNQTTNCDAVTDAYGTCKLAFCTANPHDSGCIVN